MGPWSGALLTMIPIICVNWAISYGVSFFPHKVKLTLKVFVSYFVFVSRSFCITLVFLYHAFVSHFLFLSHVFSFPEGVTALSSGILKNDTSI